MRFTVLTAIARCAYRYPLLVIGVWIVLAVAANSGVPRLEQLAAGHDQPLLPSDTASSQAVQRSAAAFSQVPSDNVGYVILERDGPLNDSDRACYDQLIAALRSDSAHVIEVVDWWGVPVSADAALSDDHQVATGMVRLAGMLGTSEAKDSIAATRSIAARLHPPDGLHIFIAGRGATIVDELSAFQRETLAITAISAAALLVLLLIVYRSPITAMVPLLSGGFSLAVARPLVARLASHHLIGVSLFSIAFGALLMLGASTGFAVFLIGRYHERRRQNIASPEALAEAYRGVAPVIVGSTLILITGLGGVSVSRISVLHNSGIPCAVGIFTASVAALTLTPALVALASRAELLKPRRQGIARRWRRFGVLVARWPGPMMASSGALLFALTMPLTGIRVGWDEAAAAPANSESSRGYQAVDHHFAANQLLPDVVTIETDHDIRNPAGLIAVEQITGAVMTIPGVRMVQSASRLNGMVPQQAMLTVPVGSLGDRLDEAADRLASREGTFTDLDDALGEMSIAIDGMQDGLQQGSAGLGRVSSAAGQLQQALTKLRASVHNLSEIFSPLASAVAEVPDCLANPVCAAVHELVEWADVVLDGSAKLADGVGQIAYGISATSGALAGLPVGGFNFGAFAGQMHQARAATDSLRKLLNSFGTPINELPGYVHDLAAMFHGTPGVGLGASLKALTDPSTRAALDIYLSPNGRATRLFVYSDGHGWAGWGAERARDITAAVRGATKGSTLKPTAVELAGVGPATRDLQDLARNDGTFLLGAILAVIFALAWLLLKSPVAGLLVIAAATTSYGSALGANVVFWQYLLRHNLHWPVSSISFFVLVTVGCAYNLYLALRVREELPTGSRVSVIRALAATGPSGTTAGIAFATTMFALALSSVLSVRQIGVTVGVGMVLDTLVVRRFLLPAIIAWLGHRFWWPRSAVIRPRALERVTAASRPA